MDICLQYPLPLLAIVSISYRNRFYFLAKDGATISSFVP